MHYHPMPCMITRYPLNFQVLWAVTVSVLLLWVLSQAVPARAGDTLGIAYIANYNAGTVSTYTIAPDGNLLLRDSVAAGQGTRALALHPSKRYLYAANNLSHEITLYDIDRFGTLTKRRTSGPILSETIFDPARSMAISPNGLRLYLPEYLDTPDCIPVCAPANSWLKIYAIDGGFLEFQTTVDSGQIPRVVAVTHAGLNVYVAT